MTMALTLNGNDVAELRAFCDLARTDPAQAQRKRAVTATWTGADRSRVASGDVVMEVSPPRTFGPMTLVLAAIASCEVDVIATHCTLMGIEIEALTVEARGDFDVRSYLGIAGTPPSGYGRISYTARLRAPSITDAQLARLREAVEHGSPVGDTLTRQVTLDGTIEPA